MELQPPTKFWPQFTGNQKVGPRLKLLLMLKILA